MFDRRTFFKGVAGLMVPAALGLQVDPEPVKRHWSLDRTMVEPSRMIFDAYIPGLQGGRGFTVEEYSQAVRELYAPLIMGGELVVCTGFDEHGPVLVYNVDDWNKMARGDRADEGILIVGQA